VLALLLAALLVSGGAQARPAPDADPQTRPPAASADAPVDLDDIIIEGRRLEDATEDFVRSVADPAPGRGLARWRGAVCPGVVNLRGETAQYIVDRVSTVAADLGLRTGAPGCKPNVVIIATTQADAFTASMVDRQPRLFVPGGTGMNQSREALDRFKTADRPVRWWTISMPVDGDTGVRAVRMPGDVAGSGTGGADGRGSAPEYAPNIALRSFSRMSTQTVDDIQGVYVIIDADRIGDVSLTQLADYVALVSMAQIDPEADTSRYATILNVFDDPTQTQTLTHWDQAYMEGLYDAHSTKLNLGARRGEIADSIVRVHHRITDDPAPQ